MKNTPLLSYDGLVEWIGISRSSIERMVRAGTFPKPLELSPNRRAWEQQDIIDWLETRRAGLASRAVDNPDDIKPEQLVSTILELGARAFSDRVGEVIGPGQLSISISERLTNEELTSCRAAFLERFEELCGHFTHDRALYVAASLFPSIRAQLAQHKGYELFRDPDTLREMAIDVLDDELWAELEAAVKADPRSNAKGEEPI